jgi:RNA polymerase subunit RPABC4/transcription elongation factor Spt4
MDDNRIDPGHIRTRGGLRTTGLILVVIGLVCTVTGGASFFLAFGSGQPPVLFPCCFCGLPLLFVGLALTLYGYMGKIMRYQAQEMAPPTKDTFNYMADGTKDGIKTVVGAIGEGLRESGIVGGSQTTMVRCHKCNALAPADAKFCNQCGHSLGKTKACPDCRELNDPDAKFCDNCGRAFG